MSHFVTVANKDELRAGECKSIEISGKTIALYNCENKFYATDNVCLHQGGPLGEGELNGKVITCPWHQWQFDITTGENTLDTSRKVVTFEVRVAGEDVQVKI